ncbi:MAG: helix-turn-helix transcriptional regulator [Clostridia bacterium]|nr:helix-turn-helix transcriptional regulator [Clostridia bacterium]
MKNIWNYLIDVDTTNLNNTKKLGSRENIQYPLVVNCAGKISNLTNADNNNTGRLDYYLLYIYKGEMNVYNNGVAQCVKEGDVIIFPPNKHFRHECLNTTVSYLWAHFTGSDVLNILDRYGIKLFPAINKANGENRISNRFQKLFEGFAKKDKFRDYDLSSLLDRLLIEIGRAISVEQGEKLLFAKSIRYINEYYSTQIKITDLAKMENVSMTTYNLHFKRQMGMSPTKYILALRMHSAKELLESSKLSVRDIGAMCGYEDFNFFTKTFKGFTGLSPLAYRKSLKS